MPRILRIVRDEFYPCTVMLVHYELMYDKPARDLGIGPSPQDIEIGVRHNARPLLDSHDICVCKHSVLRHGSGVFAGFANCADCDCQAFKAIRRNK